MADALIASLIVNKLTSRRERFIDDEDLYYMGSGSPTPSSAWGATSAPRGGGKGFDAFSFIVSALISAIAVYLSWTCNSALGYNMVEKVLYALAAGFFGVVYLFYFVLIRGDTCKAATK